MALTFRKKAALELFRGYRAVQARRHPLRYLFWECTLRCNLNCLHCGSDCTRDAQAQDMPLSDFLMVLDSLPKDEVPPQETLIVVTGGEPLLRKDLAEAGREFQKRGFPWGFVTNGLAMNERRLREFVDAGLSSLTVSLDGLESSHNRFRGRDQSFRKALNAIHMASSVPGLTLDAVTCVNQINFHELCEIRSLLVQAGLKRWRLGTVFPKGRAKTHDFLFLTDEQFRGLFEFIRQTRLQGQIRANYGCEGYLEELEGQVRDTPFFCQAGIKIGSVLVDGSISACPSLRADYIQGNIYQDDFFTIWDTKFQVMRDRSWAKTGECADCDSWKYCQGNGLHLRDEKTGELLLCHLNKLRRTSTACK